VNQQRGDFPQLELDDAEILTSYSSAPFELSELEEMLRQDPENEMLLDIAAFKYYTSGALDHALLAYQKLVKLNYQKPLYHFYLGNTFYKLHKHTEAIAEWEATKSLDPHSAYGRKAAERLTQLRPTNGG
jgi:tetratricopeptide (TPR) repeat protein